MSAPRPRSRRRTIVKVIALLAAGAALNVAVAWGFAARRASLTIERYEQSCFVIWGRPWTIVQQRRIGMIDVWWYDLYDENPRTTPAESLVSSFNEKNRQRRASGDMMPSGRPRQPLADAPRWGTFRDDPLPGHVFMGGDIAVGFPMVSLWMNTTNDMIGNSTTNEQLHGGWVMRGQLGSRSNRFIALPHRPLWPGFAVNTLFYAVALWLLFAGAFALRRIFRRRRGQCPACAYPIGTSEVCTECGAAVTKASRDQGIEASSVVDL